MTLALQASDTQVRGSVARELAWTAGVDDTDIRVIVTGAQVTLAGTVGSYPEKLLAESTAAGVRGVAAVDGRLSVRETPEVITDAELARRACEALRRTVQIPDAVGVTVHDHAVVLSGEVRWDFEREAAVRAVRYLRGVRSIENTMTIGRRVLMAGTRTNIVEALGRNSDVAGERVTVTTEAEGLVILDGDLGSAAEVSRAEQVAWSAPGVNAVSNHIGVRA